MGVDSGFNMLTKLPGDRRDFLGNHFFNKFPFTRRSLEELNVFEGGRSEDRHGLGVCKLMGKADSKVFKHNRQEV